MIGTATIERARSVRLEDELSRRGIRLRGRNGSLEGPCPRCGGHDRFAVSLKKQLFNCRGCGARGSDSIALVPFLDGTDFRIAIQALTGDVPERSETSRLVHPPSPPPAPPPRSDDGKNRERALRIWGEAADPRGTIVEAYLHSRALELPDECAGEAIRFHTDCPFSEERHPAMTALVRNIVTGEQQAIIRTALTSEGRAIKRGGKTFRMSLGPVAGGAVKLDQDEHVTQGLCIGEGVETCLAARQMGLRPVWALLGTAGVAGLPVLPGIDGLHIFREVDGASTRAVKTCAALWHAAGRTVVIVDPDQGNDLNDELREPAGCCRGSVGIVLA